MNKTATPKLRKTFSNVLSDMAFMFISDPDETSPAPNYTLETRISYRGPHTGTIHLRCDGRFAAALAGNLLGLDAMDNEADQQRLDALKELMNVVCGNLVTALYGTDGLYDLTIPEVVPLLLDAPLESPKADEIHTLVVDDHVIELAHRPE